MRLIVHVRVVPTSYDPPTFLRSVVLDWAPHLFRTCNR